MKIGLIGGRGYLGSYITKQAIADGHNLFYLPVRDKISKQNISTIKKSLFSISLCDVVINCAASKNPKNKFDKFINESLPKLIENYISKNKISCRFIHISSMNVLFNFLNDNYTKQKRVGEDKLSNLNTYIIRPGLIWSWEGRGQSKIIFNYLSFPLPIHFMIKPGNIYRPIEPQVLAKFICDELIKNKMQKIYNVLGDKRMSLWDLTIVMSGNKKLFKVNDFLLQTLKFFKIYKISIFEMILQQIFTFDRTGDNNKLIKKNILNFSKSLNFKSLN